MKCLRMFSEARSCRPSVTLKCSVLPTVTYFEMFGLAVTATLTLLAVTAILDFQSFPPVFHESCSDLMHL